MALLKKGFALYNPVCSGSFPPAPPLAIITDKVVGLSYPKFALLATRGLVLKVFMEEQRTILARKTYALDTAWWRENSRVKLAKTTSYIQYRLIQQSWGKGKVGVTGFEPATTRPPDVCATELRHTPKQ